MKRLLILALCAFVTVPFCRGEIEKTATVGGPGVEFYWWPKVDAPSGFVHDLETSRKTGTKIFVQAGSNFRDSETVIYARAIYKPRKPEWKTLRMMMDSDIVDAKGHNPKLVITPGDSLKDGDGKTLPVLVFTPNDEGSWETVAYGEEGEYYLLFTISSHTKIGYESKLPAFHAMISDYHEKAPAAPTSPPPAANVPAPAADPPGTAQAGGSVTPGDSNPAPAQEESQGPLREYEVSDPPKLISRVAAVYPRKARRKGLEGWVKLAIVVDETGTVVTARVTDTSNEIFNQSAIDAVRQWRYTQAAVKGQKVTLHKSVMIVYKIHP